MKYKSSAGSAMLEGNERSPQAEPVKTRISDGLKFSPVSLRRKIPSSAKSEGGGNIRVKKIPSVSAVSAIGHRDRHTLCRLFR